MPRIEGTSNRQSEFLRALRRHGDQLPPEQWPTTVVLRRWMRHDGFRRALKTLRQTLRFRTNLELLAAAATATRLLQSRLTEKPPAAGDGEPAGRSLAPAALMSLLRFAHQRGVADFEPEADDRVAFLRKRRRTLAERQRQAKLQEMIDRF